MEFNVFFSSSKIFPQIQSTQLYRWPDHNAMGPHAYIFHPLVWTLSYARPGIFREITAAIAKKLPLRSISPIMSCETTYVIYWHSIMDSWRVTGEKCNRIRLMPTVTLIEDPHNAWNLSNRRKSVTSNKRIKYLFYDLQGSTILKLSRFRARRVTNHSSFFCVTNWLAEKSKKPYLLTLKNPKSDNLVHPCVPTIQFWEGRDIKIRRHCTLFGKLGQLGEKVIRLYRPSLLEAGVKQTRKVVGLVNYVMPLCCCRLAEQSIRFHTSVLH